MQEQQQIQEELQALRSGLWSATAVSTSLNASRSEVSVNDKSFIEKERENHDVSAIFSIVIIYFFLKIF